MTQIKSKNRRCKELYQLQNRSNIAISLSTYFLHVTDSLWVHLILAFHTERLELTLTNDSFRLRHLKCQQITDSFEKYRKYILMIYSDREFLFYSVYY